MPDPNETTEEELDIDQQLDALLAELQQLEPGLLKGIVKDATPPPAAAPTPAPKQADDPKPAEVVAEKAPTAEPAVSETPPEPAPEPKADQPAVDPIAAAIDQQLDTAAEDQAETPPIGATVDGGSAEPTEQAADGPEPTAASLDALLNQEDTATVEVAAEDNGSTDATAAAVEPSPPSEEAQAPPIGATVDGGSAEPTEQAADDPEPTAASLDALLSQHEVVDEFGEPQASNIAEATVVDPIDSGEVQAQPETENVVAAEEVSEAKPVEQAVVASEEPQPQAPTEALEATEVPAQTEQVQAQPSTTASTAAAQEKEEITLVAEDDPAIDEDLARQLTELLDESKDEEILAPQDKAPEKPASEQGADKPQAASPEVQAEAELTPDADAVLNVDQIDALLAEQADDTLGDEFDTASTAQAAVHVDLSQTQQPQPEAADDKTAVAQAEGSSSANGGAGDFDADADAVAKELDEQEDKNASLVSVAQMSEPDQAEDPPSGLAAKVVICDRVLRRVCAVVNRPLQTLPDNIRTMVGYTAIAHLAIGSALILGKVTGIM